MRFKHLLLLPLALMSAAQFAAAEDDQCELACARTCHSCPEPKTCTDDEMNCGLAQAVGPCEPDAVCVPMACDCKSLVTFKQSDIISTVCIISQPASS